MSKFLDDIGLTLLWSKIKSWCNTQFLKSSGGNMTGNIAMGGNKVTGLGTPTSTTDAATKKYVDDSLGSAGGFEVGDILLSVRSNPGTDWLLCDGGSFDSSLYPNLSAVLPPLFGESSTLFSYNSTWWERNSDAVYDSVNNRWIFAAERHTDSGYLAVFYYIDENTGLIGKVKDSVTTASSSSKRYGILMYCENGKVYVFYGTGVYILENLTSGVVRYESPGLIYVKTAKYGGVWLLVAYHFSSDGPDSYSLRYTTSTFNSTSYIMDLGGSSIPIDVVHQNGMWIVIDSALQLHYTTSSVPTSFSTVAISGTQLSGGYTLRRLVYFKYKWYLFGYGYESKNILVYECSNIKTGVFSLVNTISLPFTISLSNKERETCITNDDNSIVIATREGVYSTDNPEGNWSYQSFSATQISSSSAQSIAKMSNGVTRYFLDNAGDVSSRVSPTLPNVNIDGVKSYIKAK